MTVVTTIDASTLQRLAGSMAILCARLGRHDLVEGCVEGQRAIPVATDEECTKFAVELALLRNSWIESVRAHQLWEN